MTSAPDTTERLSCLERSVNCPGRPEGGKPGTFYSAAPLAGARVGLGYPGWRASLMRLVHAVGEFLAAASLFLMLFLLLIFGSLF